MSARYKPWPTLASLFHATHFGFNMKGTPTFEAQAEKRGHVCPPSDATHPRDRWESLFVYSFICKFTQLRAKADGLDSPMECVCYDTVFSFSDSLTCSIDVSSFEDALLVNEANPVITQILARFVQNLRPQTRNLRLAHVAQLLGTLSIVADVSVTKVPT